MFATRLFKNKEKAKRIVHIIAGLIILLHAYEYYDNGEETYKLFLFAGLLFLAIAVLHPIIEKKHLGLTACFLQLKASFTWLWHMSIFTWEKGYSFHIFDGGNLSVLCGVQVFKERD